MAEDAREEAEDMTEAAELEICDRTGIASVGDASLSLAASLSAREETRDAEIVEVPVRVGITAVAFPTTEAKLEES